MAEVYNKGKLDILQQEFKQWGYGYNGDTIRFPISFPKKVFICLVTPNSAGQGVPHSEQLTNAGFYLLSGTQNHAYYFVLGN